MPETASGSTVPEITVQYSPEGGNTDQLWYASNGQTTTFTLNYLAQAIPAPQGASPPAPYTNWAITGLGMGVGEGVFATGGSITVYEYFCLNTTVACTPTTYSGYMEEVITGGVFSSYTICTPNGAGSRGGGAASGLGATAQDYAAISPVRTD